MFKVFSRISILVVLFVSVLSVTVFAADTVFGDESADYDIEEGTAVVNADALWLRSEPNFTSSVLAKIPINTVVSVLEYEFQDDWCRLSYNGLYGYVRSVYLDYTAHELWFYTSIVSCTESGLTWWECSKCSYHVIVNEIPALGHDLFSVYSGPHGKFSCETGGWISTWCQRDLCTYESIEPVPPGHLYTEVASIKPTYHSTGTQTLQCENCGHRDYITIPILIDDGMSEDIFSLGQAFMSGTWKLFGVYVPGFGFTFGGLMIGMALVSISLAVIYMLFGFGRRGSAAAARTSSTNNAKISKEREKDEY